MNKIGRAVQQALIDKMGAILRYHGVFPQFAFGLKSLEGENVEGKVICLGTVDKEVVRAILESILRDLDTAIIQQDPKGVK